MTTPMTRYRYVDCRSFGHQWHPTEVTRNVGWGYGVEIECRVCKMHRLDTINSRGEVGKRRYIQPPGYAKANVKVRSKYRKEYLRRAVNEAAT